MSQRATWLSVHVRRNSAYGKPGGASSETDGCAPVGVPGWVELSEPERPFAWWFVEPSEICSCWDWKEAVGEAGEPACEMGADISSSSKLALALATAAVMTEEKAARARGV